MRKKTMSTFMMVAAMALMAVVVIFLVFYSTTLNLPTNTAEMFIAILPGLFLFFVGVMTLWMAKVSLFAFPGFTILGIGIAVLLGEIETSGFYPIYVAGGPTIGQYQWAMVLLCSMIGAVVAAGSRKQ